MEYEGKFTEDDVDNDGEIKRYAGKQAAQVASRQSSDLYQMFEKVCENKGLDPWQVLGDHIVRALNNEEHAGMLSNIDVNMSKLQKGSIRVEDAKLLREFAEQLGIGFGEDDGDDELEDIFKQRIRSQLQSPFAGVTDQTASSEKKALQNEILRLRKEIEEMKEGEGSTGERKTVDDTKTESKGRDIDDAFDEAMSKQSSEESGSSDSDDSNDGENSEEDGDDVDRVEVKEGVDEEEDEDDGPTVDDAGGPVGINTPSDPLALGSNDGEIDDE